MPAAADRGALGTSAPPGAGVAIRNDVRPGDFGRIIALHAEEYGRDLGFDLRFEAYVARTFAIFERGLGARDRLWLAEHGTKLVGCIGIVAAEADVAQLRWFLVERAARGSGLGRRLLECAVTHCREAGFERVFLLTVSELDRAAHLYGSMGFRLVERTPVESWGRELIDERHELRLR